MKKGIMYLIILSSLIQNAQGQRPLRLWYDHPAQTWKQCLPLGNGRLGAMPDGGITTENIVLNDITLWSGGPQDADRKNAQKYLPQIRQLLFEGKNAAAQALINKDFVCKGAGSGRGQSANLPYGCYQMLGNLHLQYSYDMAGTALLARIKHYDRTLSLDSAVASCSYELGDVNYYRQYFTSFSNDVIIIRLKADQPGKINVILSLNRPERYSTIVQGDELDMRGQLNNGTDGRGMRYMARVRMKLMGGRLLTTDSTLQVEKADSVIIYLSAGTSFQDNPFERRTLRLLQAALEEPFNRELATHVNDYQRLFKRASLQLYNENSTDASLPTDKRLIAFVKDPTDNGLPVLYFQFGRYLLICSTRPGLLPPNLQGLWANTIQTPWNGDYHLDINLEMNHWPLEETNLPILNQPFYQLVKNMVEPGQKTAKAYYGAKGWVAFSITNLWRYTSPGEDASWGLAISGSGWLCQMLWDHYAFTSDTDYLKKIYPIIKEAAIFYLASLVKDPHNNWLVTAPSISPENSFRLPNGKIAEVCAGPTIDNQVIRELFSHVIEASYILHTDMALTEKLKKAQRQLPPNQISKDGRLMEWLKPYHEPDPHNRHLSPVWGLYPGTEISRQTTPLLANAVKNFLVRRGDESTGWSLAWKINLWARLGDGKHAFRLLRDLLKPTQQTGYNMVDGGGTYPNLFDAHPPFQIDGNFGGCAAIAEMLIQSQDGHINLLPALPQQWSSGSFSGLCVRGGAQVSLTWKLHQLVSATILSTCSHLIKVKIPSYIKLIRLTQAGSVNYMHPVDGLIHIYLPKGDRASLDFFHGESTRESSLLSRWDISSKLTCCLKSE
jgi:alpha-L-fucosidase 2